MSDKVRVRYVGPQTEGLWIPDTGHGGFDFPHNEWVDDVPRPLAEDLAKQCEPVGEPVVVDVVSNTRHQPMRPVFETDPAIAPPDHSPQVPKPAAGEGAPRGAKKSDAGAAGGEGNKGKKV